MANTNDFCLDKEFMEYLMSDYFMNTYMTNEKFQGFKLLYNLMKG
jgi:hypothetical protein